MRLILFRAAYNLPVTGGLASGIFAAHGVDLDIEFTRGSKTTVERLLAGDRDLGVLAADDVIYEVATHGRDLVMVMGLHGGLLTLVARTGLVPSDPGRIRVGVDDRASGYALVAARLLALAGARDYDMVEVGGHEVRLQALLAGTIDVTLLTPPFSLEALSRGFTMLARARDHLRAYQGSVGVTTRRWAARNGDALVAYIRAYRASVRWLRDDREAAVARLVDEFGLSRSLASESYDALIDPEDGLFPDAGLDPTRIETVQQLRVAAGLLDSPPPDASRYVDPEFLRRASAPASG